MLHSRTQAKVSIVWAGKQHRGLNQGRILPHRILLYMTTAISFGKSALFYQCMITDYFREIEDLDAEQRLGDRLSIMELMTVHQTSTRWASTQYFGQFCAIMTPEPQTLTKLNGHKQYEDDAQFEKVVLEEV